MLFLVFKYVNVSIPAIVISERFVWEKNTVVQTKYLLLFKRIITENNYLYYHLQYIFWVKYIVGTLKLTDKSCNKSCTQQGL